MKRPISVEEYRQLLAGAAKPKRKKAARAPGKRRRMSPTEELEVQMQAAGVPAWTPEHRFHATRRWRLDYAWPERLVAVEVHGGTWADGRHTRGAGFASDREKMNTALLVGWRVLEVTTDHVRSGQALSWLEEALGLEGADG
jgi:hypothetical protein